MRVAVSSRFSLCEDGAVAVVVVVGALEEGGFEVDFLDRGLGLRGREYFVEMRESG